VVRQAHPPLRGLVGLAAAAALVAVLPAFGQPNPRNSAAKLRLENSRLAAKSRSAVLDLYSLDSRLAAAHIRVTSVQGELQTLRGERAVLTREQRAAHSGELASEHQLASRLRQLYEQGDVSTIEVVFSATSISDAMTQLDNVHRVASLNDEVLAQLRSAQTRLVTTSRRLATRTADLGVALRTAAANEESLSRTQATRRFYVASLATRRNLNSAQITRLEAEARVAQTKSQRLTGSVPDAVVAAPVASGSQAASAAPPDAANWQAASAGPPGSRTLTVTITGYALPGTTATGIPVGWGVAAVDPRVIPLGSHIWVPGYGEAVAADVGGAIVGARVDLWFPTVSQARLWGLQTLTIALG
jgi:3D (Asp-Asp-Asp) domain-containing protein